MPRSSAVRQSAVVIAAIMAGLLAAPAYAHPGAHHVASMSTGFLHPLSGLDHLLAMLAVGVWAAQQRRAAWTLFAAFPVAMILGALLGAGGFVLPLVEPGIAASVLVLGLLVAFAVRMPVLAGGAMVAAFGVFHGYAHGSELPAGAAFASYGAGFLLSTLALHIAGATGSRALQNLHAASVRAAGAGVAMTGAWMLATI